MNNFRKPKNNKRPKSLDGFINTRSSNPLNSRGSVQSKFRTSYSPTTKSNNTFRSSRSSMDGFTPRSQSLQETNTKNSVEKSTVVTPQKDINNFEVKQRPIQRQFEAPKTKRRFLFWSKKQKKEKKPRSNIRKIARSFSILLLACIIGVASLFGYGYLKARNIFNGNGDGAAALQKDVDPARLNGEGDGRVNVLLVGKGGPGHEAPDLTDTLLLASIDPIQNEAALVSVPRDLYVEDQSGYSSKINAVYSNAKQARLANGNDSDSDTQAAENAGLDAIKDSISEVLGVPIHYYVMIDFTAFEDAINTVGGVTVDVKEALYDSTVAWELGGNPLIADQGLQTFDGRRALFYARSRKGSARGDFDRTERQREIIVALQQKLLSAGTFSNPFKVIELLNTFGAHVRTDLNGLDEIKRFYEIGQKIGSDKINSIGLADPPNVLVTTDFVDSQSVVVPTAGLYQYDEIKSFIRNNIRDAFLKSEDARVIILNGTEVAGFATARSEELKSYGYNVVSVDNAPTSNYTNSLIIDNSNGVKRYTKNYLEKRFGLQASNQTIAGVPDSSQADFVIILGTDEISKANR